MKKTGEQVPRSMKLSFVAVVACALSLFQTVVAQEAPALKGEKEKISYVVGLNLGNQLRVQSIDVDADLVAKGIRDALAGGRPLLTPPEVRSILNALQHAMKRKQVALQREGMLTGITVSFKLDPRLTGSLYMGDRWVSPPIYTRVGDGKSVIVEARAHGRINSGQSATIKATWVPTDPEMVTVTPQEGHEVKIAVLRAGQSSVQVTSRGVSRELAIRATDQGNSLQLEIAQGQ